MKILLINGPPSSGKDTLARAIYDYFYENPEQPECHFDRFSMPIKNAFSGMVGAKIDQFGAVRGWEDIKDTPVDYLNGKSYRQWQIDFSEHFMKPLYGEDCFGRLFCERIERLRDNGDLGFNHNYVEESLIVVPDSGFQIEVDTIEKLLPNDEVLLLRLHRNGTSFDNDSRGYVIASQMMDISNNASQGVFEEWGRTVAHNFVRGIK